MPKSLLFWEIAAVIISLLLSFAIVEVGDKFRIYILHKIKNEPTRPIKPPTIWWSEPITDFFLYGVAAVLFYQYIQNILSGEPKTMWRIDVWNLHLDGTLILFGAAFFFWLLVKRLVALEHERELRSLSRETRRQRIARYYKRNKM